MEVDVGQHCSFPECKRLDFLPFVCEHCQQVFCLDHRAPSSHDCQNVDAKSVSDPPEKQLFLFQCSLAGCKKRDVAEVTCPSCKLAYCIQHRHQTDHNCPVQPDTQTTTQKRERPAERLPAKPSTTSGIKGGRSSKHTSAKVMLMKLKMKAVGQDSIPQSERVYFEVQLPRTSGLPNTPMFFSKEWSIGKIVDYIAQRFKLKNENHKTHSQKLQLVSEGGVLRMAERIETVTMGTTLTLEYQDKTAMDT